MGCVRDKMGKHLPNPRQQGNMSAHHSSNTAHSQIKSWELIW